MSLKEFLRKRLMLGSQCPSVEEEAENYLRELGECMKAKLSKLADLVASRDKTQYVNPSYFAGYGDGANTVLKFLRNGELEATET